MVKILPVVYRVDGFMNQPFAYGGEEGPEAFDPTVRYRSGSQNYLIDLDGEVILVDTGIPAGKPEESPDENTPIYTGHEDCARNPKNVSRLPTQAERRTCPNAYRTRSSRQCPTTHVPHRNSSTNRSSTRTPQAHRHPLGKGRRSRGESRSA